MVVYKRINSRQRRHIRLRKKILGTPERPRLHVCRALKNIRVQIIDDLNNQIILSVSTYDKDIRKNIPYGGNVKAAILLAEQVAKKAKDKGITKIVFDRGGCLYHGRIKALAENLRKLGLQF